MTLTDATSPPLVLKENQMMDRDAFMVGFKEEAAQLYRAADAMMEARK